MKKNINIILFCTIICLVFGCANAEIDINENADELQLQTLNQNAVDLCELDDGLEEPEMIIPAVLDKSSPVYKCWAQSRVSTLSDATDGNEGQGLLNTLFDLRDTPVRIMVKTGEGGRYFTAKRKKYKKGLKTHYASIQAVFDEKKDMTKETSQVFYLSYVPLVGEYTMKANFTGDKDDYYMVPGYLKSSPNDYFIFGSTAGAGTEGEFSFIPTEDGYFNIETILVGSDDPENSTPYNVWNYSWENKDSKSHLDKYRNQNNQKFYIVPEDEYEVIKVEYHDDATATVAQIPDFVVRWEYENRSSVTQQLSTGFSSTATRTSSFSNTYGVSVSVTSSFSVDVPVANSNLTISMNSSYSHTWGKSETQSDTRNYNFPISVPPYCRIVAEAIVARYQLNVGYTTYLRSVNTGKEIRLEGRWRGIDCAEIKAKCTEYELDSNNITKIKTFNGVPHEAVVL